MGQTIGIVVIVGIALFIAFRMYTNYTTHMRNLNESAKDRAQGRSASAAQWATQVERPEWADRGDVQVSKQSLPDGTPIGRSSGSFSFDVTKKERKDS